MSRTDYSRLEEIIQAGLDGELYDDEIQSRVEYLMLRLIEEGGGGGGGTVVAGVSAWNGRRGSVYPANKDYSASMISTTDSSKNVQQEIDALKASSYIDTSMSSTSTNAVQNKVIDAAIKAVDAKTLPTGGGAGNILVKKDSNPYNTEWVSDATYMKKSVYDTNNNGKVDRSEKTDAVQGPISYKATLKRTSSDVYLVTDDDKGKKNGVVPLDENKKILPEYLPDGIMSGLTYGGVFNATTRVVRLTPAAKSILGVTSSTMTLENSSSVPEGYPANSELFYVVNTAGSFANMQFEIGDWLISLETEWQQLKNGTNVSSVNGMTGAVVLDSDDVAEGNTNLYMTLAEKRKLADIEAEATKDVNVIQSAVVNTDSEGTSILRLTNKNGTVTDFTGGGVDLTDYLKKTGNASDTTVRYTPSSTKRSFTGNEKMNVLVANIVTWLNSLEDVAFSGDYIDLSNRPSKTSQFTNDGQGTTAGPFITRTVNNLSNYYPKTQTYTRTEIDNKIEAIESLKFIQVDTLPTRDIDESAIYYVPNDEGQGYKRYQYMNTSWLFLGTTDVSMDGYLLEDGESSDTTVVFTQAAERVALTSGETLAESLGKIAKWYADIKQIAYTASWHDLEDGNELATQDDLDEKVDIQQDAAQAGKMLGIGDDGKVVPTAVSAGVVRKGEGARSVIGNDSEENPRNTADGANATAFGSYTKATGADQFVTGRYNVEDTSNAYAEIVGGGESTNAVNIRTTDWSGKGNYRNGVSVGNTTDHIVEPSLSNDLTTKVYVDNTIEEKIANANLLRSMVVNDVPDVENADNDILYLVPDATSEGHYNQYKKVLRSQNPDVYIMANLGGTQLSLEGTQVKNLPVASRAIEGTVYQYVGNSAAYTFGGFYACLPTQLYGWMEASTGQMYWTDTLDIKYGDEIGDPVRNGTPILGTQATDKYQVATYVGPTASYVDLPNRIRSTLGTWYTRDTNGDRLGNWHWVELIATKADLDNKQDKIIDGPDIGYLDDNLGLTHFEAADKTTHQIKGLSVWNYIKTKFTKDSITTVSDTTSLGTVDKSKANVVQETTAKALFDYIKGKLTGAISTVLTSNLTASRAVVTNTSGKVAVSATTSTELGYLSGATSKIQTQLDNKLSKTWTYVGILGAARGSSLTIGDDWNELDLVMRVKEGSSVYNLSDIKTKLDFTAGDPTSYSTFIGFYWNASFSCGRRIGLSGSGTNRKINVNWDAENGWALQGIYIYKR